MYYGLRSEEEKGLEFAHELNRKIGVKKYRNKTETMYRGPMCVYKRVEI